MKPQGEKVLNYHIIIGLRKCGQQGMHMTQPEKDPIKDIVNKKGRGGRKEDSTVLDRLLLNWVKAKCSDNINNNLVLIIIYIYI